jgi:hypothetical protein
MPLPHNEVYNPVSATEAIQSLRKSPETDIVFAVSQGFWDDDSGYDSVYPAYENYFEERCRELIAILGKPTFDGHWMKDSYPLFAIGERAAVWGSGDDTIYLRILHEDPELGIEVSLLTPRSPNSNHEPKSIYDELRKYAQEHSP